MLRKLSLCAALLIAALPIIAENTGPAAAPLLSEAECIAALAPESAWEQKEVACRRLRQIGTAKSVPALNALLLDEKSSHLARYALENMPAKEAAEALRKAATEATGAVKEGAIISLGARGDSSAVPVLAAALKDENASIVQAAAGALGRIGNTPAGKALLAAMEAPSDAARAAIGEGALAAAARLTAKGKGHESLALCERLLDTAWPEQVRYGAFREVIVAEDVAKGLARLVAALGGEDAKLRDYAAFLIATSPKMGATRALAKALPGLPATGQAALLTGLAGRKDAAAREATLAALESGDVAVKAAAVRALGAYGAASDVAKVAALLSAEAPLPDAATNALKAMLAPGVDEALAAATPAAQPAAKVMLLAVLADRMAPQTNAIATGALADASVDVRVAALDALAKLGGKDDVPVLLDRLKKTADPAERTPAANALHAVAGVQKDEVLAPIADALAGATVELRGVLLGALLRIGSANALQAYLNVLNTPNLEGRDEAVRLFAGWPTHEAASHFLEMAKSDEANRADLLRGYVRLARAEGDGAVKAQMLTAAMEIAQRPEEKWIVLPGWGSLATQQSIDVLKPLLDDAGVHNEAALALLTAATEFAKQGEEQKNIAIAALQAATEKTDNPAIKERIQKALDKLSPPPAPTA